jgi:non-ribosomal peptide synthetase component F
MRAVIRWLRLLLLALLIPAYGLAAAGWGAAAGAPAAETATALAAQAAEATPAEPAEAGAEARLLLAELADVSDDMPDHCASSAAGLALNAAAHSPPRAVSHAAPEAPPRRLLRPPMALA